VAPASNRFTDSDDALLLARSFQIYASYFSGNADNLFSADDQLHSIYRSFSLVPDHVIRTSDPTLIHLTATLTLTGPRSNKYLTLGRRLNHTFAESISFVLDGYYSSASLQLCMVGTGTEPAANGSLKQYTNITLRLHVPSPSTLTDPFMTGTLDGSSDFGAINLLAYDEGEDYKYGERAACSSLVQPSMGSLRTLGSDSVCGQLMLTSYMLLDHHDGAPAKLRRMHINRIVCTAEGAVHAYMLFSNDTRSGRRGYSSYYNLMVNEEAVVADGHWDSDRKMLCLRACRVVRSVPSTVAVRECKIGMSFWFPAMWTVLERSVVAGVLWNSDQKRMIDGDAGPISGVISAFSFDFDDNRMNLSDVKYTYNDTMLEVAKKHYLKMNKEKIKGLLPVPEYYTDFCLRFYMANAGSGDAYPRTIGSVVLNDEGEAADGSTRPAVVDDLLSISYDIHHYAPLHEKRVNVSSPYTLEEGQISAEGVYDPKRGIMSMVGCQDHKGSMDCQILITVQFASLGDRAQGLGNRGAINSLRDRADRLFFEKMDITMYGAYPMWLSEAISRMDLESIMLVASTTLSCLFTVLQILHTKRNPETAPAMSVTMLVILSLGHLAPLVLSFEVLFLSRRSQYFLYSTMEGWIELNQAMVRVPALIALLLQLRLLQLALFGRLRSARHQSEPTSTPSTAISERVVLQVCLPLYLLGGILTTIVHAINAPAAAAASEGSLAASVGGLLDTPWGDLVAYAGLVLDGFLLPQVILNVSGSGVRAISPWFYMGGTVIRVAPHVYDAVRGRIYGELGARLSRVYANPRGDLFGVAWDIVVPCGAALLATLLFLHQRRGDASLLPSERRTSGGYEMVSRK
jgi:hypothetical protein